MSERALRFNNGKLTWHNFPQFLMRPLAQVGHYGEGKYATFNFMKGAPISQYMDSAMRHMDSFIDPEQSDFDEESKLNHLSHAAWNMLMAVWVLKHMPELDDRFKLPVKKTEPPQEFCDGMFVELEREELKT